MAIAWTGPLLWPLQPLPDWERLQTDHEMFVAVLVTLCRAHGFAVAELRVLQEPHRSEDRQCGLLLERGRQRWAALGLRWTLPVTSDVIGRFARGLGPLRGGRGLVITTGTFTAAARTLGRKANLQLYDGPGLKRWMLSAAVKEWLVLAWRR